MMQSWCLCSFLKLGSLPKKINNDSNKDHILNSEFLKINEINDKTATLKKLKIKMSICPSKPGLCETLPDVISIGVIK